MNPNLIVKERININKTKFLLWYNKNIGGIFKLISY
jgi:hypothetical protein